MTDIVDVLPNEDIVKRLKAKPPKGFVTSPLMIDAADEIERLRQQNAELLEALKMVVCGCEEDRVNCVWGDTCTGYIANNAIAKATGGE